MKVVKMNDGRVSAVASIREFLGEDRQMITRPELKAWHAESDMSWPGWIQKLVTANRGEYYLPDAAGKYAVEEVTLNAEDSA